MFKSPKLWKTFVLFGFDWSLRTKCTDGWLNFRLQKGQIWSSREMGTYCSAYYSSDCMLQLFPKIVSNKISTRHELALGRQSSNSLKTSDQELLLNIQIPQLQSWTGIFWGEAWKTKSLTWAPGDPYWREEWEQWEAWVSTRGWDPLSCRAFLCAVRGEGKGRGCGRRDWRNWHL